MLRPEVHAVLGTSIFNEDRVSVPGSAPITEVGTEGWGNGGKMFASLCVCVNIFIFKTTFLCIAMQFTHLVVI